MNLIFLVLAAGLILLNVAGLTILSRLVTANHDLARASGILCLCAVLFFLEHLVGLGRLDWLWPLTSLVALGLVAWRWQVWRDAWRSELVFATAFAYVFAWRLAFPDIESVSERMTDLYFVANYLPGDRLPPLDRWLPPFRFDFYYAFQHYGAALLGRLFGFSVGVTYNFSFCVLVAMLISTGYAVIRHFCISRHARVLALAALVLGGNGISPFVRLFLEETPVASQQSTLTVQNQNETWHRIGSVAGAPLGPNLTLWSSMRFIGVFDQKVNTPLGKSWFPSSDSKSATRAHPPLILPLEPLSYLIFLGDYHPPLGGFLLLAVALLCIVELQRDARNRVCHALLALTVPLTLVTNAWVFPLQTALLFTWLAYRYWQRSPPDWLTLGWGTSAGWFLIFPFLIHFFGNGLNLPLAWVSPEQHTPWQLFLMMHWPLLTLLLLALAGSRASPLKLTLVIFWAILLLLSETIYIDDPYGGEYERFNTVLKWWQWIYTGATVTLLAFTLESRYRIARLLAVTVVILLCSYGPDLLRYWLFAPHPSLARFEGHYWLSRDPSNRDLIAYLRVAKPGIVLERNRHRAYGEVSAFALFSGHPAMLGWSDHEWTWRGNPNSVLFRAKQVSAFYEGKLENSLDWLVHSNVCYVIWGHWENSNAPEAFKLIQAQISPAYAWHEILTADNYRVGLWERKTQNCAVESKH